MAINNKQQVYTKNFFAKDENSEDGKGVTVINPTKNSDGTPKYIDQEDLIMYANLMVEQTPRNRVIDGDESRVINIANNRNVNFLNPSATSEGSLFSNEKLSTDWVKMFYENQPYDTESFGIEEITISNNASMVPEVDITFIDVRGKNLWERANDPNNPYNIFLTFPYPLFYLTVKGYLGEGMGMPLVLKKVNTSFSGEDGHFRTVANFQSWTFAMLNDLLMQYAVLVPYMYEQSDDSEFGYEGMEQLNEIFKRQEQGDNYKHPDQQISTNNAPLTIVDLIKNVGDVVEEINNKQVAPDIIIRKNALKQLQSEFKKMNDGVLDRFSQLANANVDQQGDYRSLRTSDGNSVDYSFLYSVIENYKENFQNISETYYNRILNEVDSSDGELIVNENIFRADISQNNGNIVTSDKFIEVMNDIFNNIFVDLNNELNDQFVNSATEQVTEKLNFQPNLENILRIFCNNLQAFLELLANKSGKAYNQVLEDTIRQSQQRANGDRNTKTEEIYPWPEYWIDEGDNGLQKEYPGKYYKGWEEVKFVNELVKARQRVDAVLNVTKDKNKVKTKQNFNALPIDHPITNRPYQSFGERDLVKEVLQRGTYSVFHEGYLYYGDQESVTNIARNKGKLEAQNLIAVADDKGDSPNRLSNLEKLLNVIKSQSEVNSLQNVRNYIIGNNSIEDIRETLENGNQIVNLLEKPDLHDNLKMEILINNPVLFMVDYSRFSENHSPIVSHNFSITENGDQFLNNIQQNISFSNNDNVILGLLNLRKYARSGNFSDGGNDDIIGNISDHYRNWNKPMKDNYRPITNSNSGSNIKDRLFENTFSDNLPDEPIYNKEINIEQVKYDDSE